MSVEITLESVSNGPVSRTEKVPTDHFQSRLGNDLEALGETFRVEFEATLYTNVLYVKGNVQGRMGYQCSRCGERREMTIDTPFSHSYMPAGQLNYGSEEELELSEQDIDCSEHDGVKVDIEELCIDHMLVDLPFAPACSSEENGPCAKFSDGPVQYGDTQPLEPEETPWMKAIRGVKLT